MEEDPMICKHVSTMKGAVGMLRDGDHVEVSNEGSDFIPRTHAKGYVMNEWSRWECFGLKGESEWVNETFKLTEDNVRQKESTRWLLIFPALFSLIQLVLNLVVAMKQRQQLRCLLK